MGSVVPNQIADPVDQLAEREGLVFQSQFAGLDLRYVENVGEDHQQVMRGAIHTCKSLALSLIAAVALELMGDADDRVERCPDLVAHVGDEGALRASPALPFAGPFQDCARFPLRVVTSRQTPARKGLPPTATARPKDSTSIRWPSARTTVNSYLCVPAEAMYSCTVGLASGGTSRTRKSRPISSCLT